MLSNSSKNSNRLDYSLEPTMTQTLDSPLDLLKISIDEQIYVKLKDNREIVATLHAFDQHLNLVVGNAQETRLITRTNTETLEETETRINRSFDILFIRGDTIILCSKVEQ
eukprot:gnl/Dysnectes_brevis/4329_a5761_969.p1 GENE.gnl/Dysnectes_brevis/4329_a5761_969~~gnl/Dysnectes_brevis/4329_a5761_969.p1  ORF type:complete len:111 (+),score=3.00 gnl/Dysnectes_brevis/4329_a5761_969:21-353(+)